MSAALDVGAQIALITYPFVVLVLAWFIRQTYLDMKSSISSESLSRGAAIGAVRQELSTVADSLARLQREIDKDYVNYDRLTHALQPMKDGLDEIKRDQDRLFERLDGKQDKHQGRG